MDHLHCGRSESDEQDSRSFRVHVCWSGGQTRKMLLVLLLVLLMSDSVLGIRSLLPFVGEERRVGLQDRPGCYMDGQHYRFGARWSPLFEPQGVMVCIKCECLQVEKKGIVQAKGETMCRNIKDLCPRPECDHPVLKPGRCCKTCEEQDDFEAKFTFGPRGLTNDIYSYDSVGNQQDPKEFRALLIGRGVLGGPVKTRAVGVVRLTVSKGRLQFAVRYSRLDRPKYLRILDLNGNVLFERPLQKGIKGDRKACGVWSKVPSLYVTYFREEKLQAVITSSRHPRGVVGGKITPYSTVSAETFSSILIPPKPSGEGGVVSIDYNPRTRMASYDINLEGVAQSGDRGFFTVAILKNSHLIYEARGSFLPKTSKLSGKWRVAKRRYRKQLARGRLRMRITFSDGRRLTGSIQPRLMCGVFQAVLTSGQTVDKKRTSSAGSAVIQIGEDGSLDYKIRVANMENDVTRLRLQTASSKENRKSRLVGNLKRKYVSDILDKSSGWANGTYKRLGAEDVFRLLNNQLYISVATGKPRRAALRGRLVNTEYHEHFKKEVMPFTLLPITEKAKGGAAHAWLSLDAGCVLHFDAMLSAAGRRSGPFGVLLGSTKETGTRMVVLRPPAGKRGDMLYNYVQASGDSADIPDDLFRDLDQGHAYVQVNAKRKGRAVFRGNVTLRNTCWRFSNDMDSQWSRDDEQVDVSSEETGDVKTCNFEGVIYEEGSSWLPDVNASCTTCSCAKGNTLCHPMMCPPLSCEDPVHRPGECCPSCPNEDEDGKKCRLGRDPREFRLHSVWHPYLPMMGFSKCALCTCLPGGKTECNKLPCPAPACPKSQWVRSEENPCCLVCGDPPTTEAPVEEPQKDINMNGACNFLGEVKSNGDRWHPNIHPFGYMKCFFCECKDGEFHCGRLQCPVLSCVRRRKRPNVCCEECAADQPEEPRVKKKKDKQKGQMSKDCSFAGTPYKNGQRWRPNSSPAGSGECAVCKCTEGNVQCRLRCPRVCKEDMAKNPCCRHCPERKVQKWKGSSGNRKTSLQTTQGSEKLSSDKNPSPKVSSKEKPKASKKKKKRKNRKSKLSAKQDFLSMLN